MKKYIWLTLCLVAPLVHAELTLTPPAPGPTVSGAPVRVWITPEGDSTEVTFVCSGDIEECPIYPAPAKVSTSTISVVVRNTGVLSCINMWDQNANYAQLKCYTIQPMPALSISGLYFTNQSGQPVTMPAPAETTAINVAWTTNLPADCRLGGVGPQNGFGTPSHYATLSVTPGYNQEFLIQCDAVNDTTNTSSLGPITIRTLPSVIYSTSTIPSGTPERLIVKFKPIAPTSKAPKSRFATSSTLSSRFAITESRAAFASVTNPTSDLSNVYVFSMAPGTNVNEAVQAYAADPNVEYAQPDYLVEALMVPNDPLYASSGSWGQPYDDLWGLKKLDLERAWDISQGEGVTVAVVDSGVDYTHPDIANNVILLPGLDFTTCATINSFTGLCEVIKPRGNDPMDRNGHGTHVAGIIAAVGNNGQGMIGVAPKSKILPIKAIGDDGIGFSSDLAAGIVFAVQNGARVINNSWGCVNCSKNPIAEEAVQAAYASGAVVVFAAGNSNLDAGGGSPRNMTAAKPIVVASTDQNDQKSSFSNFGNTVDVAAPGGGSGDSCQDDPKAVNILSLRLMTLPPSLVRTCSSSSNFPGVNTNQFSTADQPYYRLRGTSMAAPYVSGVAALMLAAKPHMNPDQVRSAMTQNADAHGQVGLGPSVGRVNAYRALTQGEVPVAKITSPGITASVQPSLGTLMIRGSAAGATFKSYELAYAPANKPQSWTTLAADQTSPVNDGLLGLWPIKNLPMSLYLLRLRVYDQGNQLVETQSEVWIEPLTTQMTRLLSIPSNPGFSKGRITWETSEQFRTSLFTAKALEIAEPRQITTANVNTLQSVVEGNRIGYIDMRNGHRTLFVYDINTNIERMITSGDTDVESLAISGDHVAYMAQRGTAKGLYVYDWEQQQERLLTPLPSLSREIGIDGDQIAYLLSDNSQTKLYHFDLSKNVGTIVTTLAGVASGLAISGDTIVWKGDPGGYIPKPDIYAWSLSRAELQKLSNEGNVSSAPGIDHGTVVWSDLRSDLGEAVFAYNLTNGQETQISAAYSRKSTPRISGDQVIWLDDRFGTPQIVKTLIQPATPTLHITGIYFTNQNGLSISIPAPVNTTHINVGWRTNLPATCNFGGNGPQNGHGTTSHYATLPVEPGFKQTYAIDCQAISDASLRTQFSPVLVQTQTSTPLPTASIASLDHTAFTVAPTASPIPLLIRGSNFTNETIIAVNGALQTSQFLSAKELRVMLPPEFVRQPQSLRFSVNGQTSSASTLEIVPQPQKPYLVDWPEEISREGTLYVHDQGYSTTYTWTLALTETAPLSTRAYATASAQTLQGKTLTTNTPSLSLKTVNMTPGTYRIQVIATNLAGATSAPSEANVTLASSALGNMNVYPNPWRIDKHSAYPLTIAGLTPGTTVKIFTLSGHWVDTLQESGNQVIWDLKNDHGELVASGIYLFLAKDAQGNTHTGKFAVIR